MLGVVLRLVAPGSPQVLVQDRRGSAAASARSARSTTSTTSGWNERRATAAGRSVERRDEPLVEPLVGCRSTARTPYGRRGNRRDPPSARRPRPAPPRSSAAATASDVESPSTSTCGAARSATARRGRRPAAAADASVATARPPTVSRGRPSEADSSPITERAVDAARAPPARDSTSSASASPTSAAASAASIAVHVVERSGRSHAGATDDARVERAGRRPPPRSGPPAGTAAGHARRRRFAPVRRSGAAVGELHLHAGEHRAAGAPGRRPSACTSARLQSSTAATAVDCRAPARVGDRASAVVRRSSAANVQRVPDRAPRASSCSVAVKLRRRNDHDGRRAPRPRHRRAATSDRAEPAGHSARRANRLLQPPVRHHRDRGGDGQAHRAATATVDADPVRASSSRNTGQWYRYTP